MYADTFENWPCDGDKILLRVCSPGAYYKLYRLAAHFFRNTKPQQSVFHSYSVVCLVWI